MFKKKYVIPLAIFSVALAVLITYFIWEEVEEGDNELIIYGNVDIRQVDLGFRVYGKVDKLFFDEGDLVEPGQLMAQLDEEPYREKVRQAAAQVQAVQTQLMNANLIYNRRNELVDSGAISTEDYDDSLKNKNQLMADMEQAEANLAYQRTSLNDTKLFCPTAGTILTRIREPGSVVNVGEPVFTLSIKSPVWIRSYVTERELGRVYPGMRAEIHTDTETNPVYIGHVGFISPMAEFTPKNVETTSLRTDLVYRIRVVVDNPDQGLRQGMPVTVKLNGDDSAGSLRKD